MAEIVCGDQWLALVQGSYNGHEAKYVHSGDEALIVPLTAAGEIVFTVEPSPALEREVLILPGGTIEDGELSLAAGNRELQEEVGCRADRLDFLAKLHPWSKYLDSTCYVYLARGLTASHLQGDEDYEIGVVRVPLAGFERLLAEGRLTDARIVSALYLARRYLQWERRG